MKDECQYCYEEFEAGSWTVLASAIALHEEKCPDNPDNQEDDEPDEGSED